MGKTSKEGSDSKRKRKRVAVESSSDDDESEQDFEEVTKKLLHLKLDRFFESDAHYGIVVLLLLTGAEIPRKAFETSSREFQATKIRRFR